MSVHKDAYLCRHQRRMRVTGPDGLDETYQDERDALFRALDWAGSALDAVNDRTPLDALYVLLEQTLNRTGEPILVREA